jgi:hypothetical protein
MVRRWREGAGHGVGGWRTMAEREVCTKDSKRATTVMLARGRGVGMVTVAAVAKGEGRVRSHLQSVFSHSVAIDI